MKRNYFLILFCTAICCGAITQTNIFARIGVGGSAKVAQTETDAQVDARVDELLGKMTLEEKIDLLSGRREFYTFGIERLGIPSMKMADGPMGVRNYGPSTAFPAGVALAATWDTEMARTHWRSDGTGCSGPRSEYFIGAGGEY